MLHLFSPQLGALRVGGWEEQCRGAEVECGQQLSKAVRTAGGPGTRDRACSAHLPCSGLPSPGTAIRAFCHLFRNLWTEDVVGGQTIPGDSVQGPTRRARQTLVPWGGVGTTWARSLQSGLVRCPSLPSDFKPTRVNRPGQCGSHPPAESPRGRWQWCSCLSPSRVGVRPAWLHEAHIVPPPQPLWA